MNFTPLSYNRFKKELYHKKFLIKNINKTFYLFAYFPIIKSALYQQLIAIAKEYNSYLIHLPSSFRIIKESLTLQGPDINIFIGNELFLKFLDEIIYIDFLLFFFENKWYAFFILLDIITSKLIILLSKNFTKNNFKCNQTLVKLFLNFYKPIK
jgi:hypothetical protein